MNIRHIVYCYRCKKNVACKPEYEKTSKGDVVLVRCPECGQPFTIRIAEPRSPFSIKREDTPRRAQKRRAVPKQFKV